VRGAMNADCEGTPRREVCGRWVVKDASTSKALHAHARQGRGEAGCEEAGMDRARPLSTQRGVAVGDCVHWVRRAERPYFRRVSVSFAFRFRACVLSEVEILCTSFSQTFAVSILAYVCDDENLSSQNGLCATGRTLARRGAAHKRSSTGPISQ
jgi:hypothetical protein